MNEADFNTKIKELIREIANLPNDRKEQLTKLAEETMKRHKTLKMNVDIVQKSLTDLRICIKYLVFDLEATRRERDQLKAMRDDDSPEGGT